MYQVLEELPRASTDTSIMLMGLELASTTSMEVVEAYVISLEPYELHETSTAYAKADTTSLEACCTHILIAHDTGLLMSFIIYLLKELHVVDFHKIVVYLLGRTVPNEQAGVLLQAM